MKKLLSLLLVFTLCISFAACNNGYKSQSHVYKKSLVSAAGEEPDVSEVETALELLEKAIYNSLRRVDVSTKYSSKQLVVILMDANAENSEIVAQRIIGVFNKLYTGGKIRMEYGIAQMDKKGKIATVTE